MLNPKKKVWEKLSVDLATSSGPPQWQGANFVVEGKGNVTAKLLS